MPSPRKTSFKNKSLSWSEAIQPAKYTQQIESSQHPAWPRHSFMHDAKNYVTASLKSLWKIKPVIELMLVSCY